MRFSVYGPQYFVVRATSHHLLRLALASGGSSRLLANSAAQRPTLRSNAARLTKKRFEKWREKRVPSFWPPGKQTRGRWLCEGLASNFKEKKKKAQELLSWSFGYCESLVAQQTNWRTGCFLARKIRQFVKHIGMPSDRPLVLPQRCWHSTRQRRFFASRAASPNQILGIWPQ